MDIEKAELEISNIKNPLVFIFELLMNIDINDLELSIILRLFLKYHSDTAFSINLKELFFDELYNYKISWLVLTDFYKLIHDKISILIILKKWYEIYENNLISKTPCRALPENFWQLSDKINFLLEIKEYFLAIYDCSHGGIPFHNKLIDLFNCNNHDKYEVLYNIKYRLELILEIFGPKIFEFVDIPLIKVSEFFNLSNSEIHYYLSIIFSRMNELLNETIFIFTNYNKINEELENLLNPIIINIESKDIDSETDINDFN